MVLKAKLQNEIITHIFFFQISASCAFNKDGYSSSKDKLAFFFLFFKKAVSKNLVSKYRNTRQNRLYFI